MLGAFRRNVSHQEIERILSEIEAWYETSHDQAGVEWLPVDGICNFLCNDLGYEDMDEFEDAIQGDFKDFLSAFPHIEVGEFDGRVCLKVRRVEPKPARKLTINVESSAQLLETTFMKAVDAEVDIPHLSFTIYANQRRHIDSLYHHVVVARDELEAHCSNLGDTAEEKENILATVKSLGELLNVETPFVMVIKDPSGLSEVVPEEHVVSELL